MSIRRPIVAASTVIGCATALVAPTGAWAGARQLIPAARTSRSLCAPPADTVPPAVTEVTFGRASIDLNSGSLVQTVTATASDTSGSATPSGVATVRLAIEGNHVGREVKLHLTSGDAASGSWTGQFTISKYAHPGTYSIGFLGVADTAGNDQLYTGRGRIPDGPDALSLHPADDPTFTVTGTPAIPPARKTPGTLSAFTINRTSVDTTSSTRRVQFTARFHGAAPGRVSVGLNSITKPRHVRFVYLRAALHNSNGTWSGAVRVPQWLGRQTLGATLYAYFGRAYRPAYRSYNAEKLRRLHFPSRVGVVSASDHTRPLLTSVSFSPSSIDSTAGPEQVTVTAQATDTGSGVRSIQVSGGIRRGVNGVAGGLYPFASAGVGYLSSDDFRVRLKKTAGGDWVGTTTIKRCVPSGTYKLDVSISDGADNSRYYSTKELADAGITSTVDVTSKHGDVAAPYVFSAATYGADHNLFLNFSEGVSNVSTSTLSVYAMFPRRSRYSSPLTISSLTCANGTTTVDCSGSGGLITSVKMTIPGLTPGDKYQVYANVNQVVPQLTDGNGNPMQWDYRQAEVKDA